MVRTLPCLGMAELLAINSLLLEIDGKAGAGGGLPTVYQGVFSAAREGLKVVPVFNMAQATLRRRSAIDRKARPWL